MKGNVEENFREVIKTSFEKNMMDLPAEKKTIVVEPEIEPFDGIEFARMTGAPEFLIKKMKEDKEDTIIDHRDEYGFFGFYIVIYTKKRKISFTIPFAKQVVINISKIPDEIKEEVKEILQKKVKEAHFWTSTTMEQRQEWASLVRMEAYASLKRLKFEDED